MASSGYTAITFIANEQPTTAKWNLIGSNDASFNNGNGFEDGIIVNRHYADASIDPVHHALRTRRVMMQMKADGSGGAVEDHTEANAIAFTGTPGGYARGKVIVPMDYADGDANIKLILRASSTNNSKATHYFVHAQKLGDVNSTWNIAASQVGSVSVGTTWTSETIETTIPEANLEPGSIVGFAWRPSVALTGTVFLLAAVLEYQANS
jgi:hypothetical protein